jgi:dolichyl-phosphooligosaccharide-protein glycotransferase
MIKKPFPDLLFTILALVATCLLASFLRIALPYATVFGGQWIKLTGIDAYFYMRMVDNLVNNFPTLYSFDPYLIFPDGFSTAGFPAFFAYLLAGSVKLLGGAAPSQQVEDSIAVYVPAVLGIITVIPVYFVGRALFNKWAGLIAAVLTAIMPGEILSRSLLGYTDHHVAEVLLTVCFSLFFILAVKNGRQFTYNMLIKGQFPAAGRHLQYSLVAGLFLGLYLITWTGALLFVFIVFIYFVLQFISDHLRGFPTDYLSKIAITCFLVALLIFLPVSRDKLTLLALAVIILAPIVLNVMSALMAARGMNPALYPVAVAVITGLGVLAASLIFPSLFHAAAFYITNTFSWRTEQNVVGEMKALFFPGGTFTLETAWSQFALIFYAGLAGLALLIYRSVREGGPELIYLAVWSVVMMFASFAMVRFAAYFAISLALATGYLAVSAAGAFVRHDIDEKLIRPRRKTRGNIAAGWQQLRPVLAGVAVAVVLTALIVPGTVNAVGLARNPGHTPSNAWLGALDWMQKNTPEPLGRADAYYSLIDRPSPGKTYQYPPTAYGVIVWSDYGYWVTRIAHRIPTSNPGSYPVDEAKFFTAQDGSNTPVMLDKWQARYVVIDNRIASPNDKFYSLANLSGKNEADFYELCWQKKDGKYAPLLVFYPEFYRSTVIHLYNFNGKQITPQSTPVIAYRDRIMPGGQRFKEITGTRSFVSYAEARSFIAGQNDPSTFYRIIGTDPLVSPVPLAAMPGYSLAYQSPEKASAGSTPVPEIKIFEFRQTGQ